MTELEALQLEYSERLAELFARDSLQASQDEEALPEEVAQDTNYLYGYSVSWYDSLDDIDPEIDQDTIHWDESTGRYFIIED